MTFDPWPDQRVPALAIVARGDQIEPAGPTEFIVRSQSQPDARHRVTSIRDKWSCSCPFYVETHRTCIHIVAVRIKNGYERLTEPPKTIPSCVACRSARVVINGVRRNHSGAVQRYLCRACGKRFSGSEGFRNRRASPEKIALALDLYFRGLSLRKVVEHLDQVYGLHISAMTVYRWVAHFGTLAGEWMDKQGASVGERWHVDETVVNINGENTYLWNVLDSETRFLLATHVSKTRSLSHTRAPLRKAKEHTTDRPKEVFTDGMTAYPLAVFREFGRHRRPGDPPVDGKVYLRSMYSPHHLVPSIRAPESNNLVERLHGTEKERVKVMRAFDNERGTGALMEGFRAHYNLVRTHQTLKTTPGLAAGYSDLGRFRWHELILRAVQIQNGGP